MLFVDNLIAIYKNTRDIVMYPCTTPCSDNCGIKGGVDFSATIIMDADFLMKKKRTENMEKRMTPGHTFRDTPTGRYRLLLYINCVLKYKHAGYE